MHQFIRVNIPSHFFFSCCVKPSQITNSLSHKSSLVKGAIFFSCAFRPCYLRVFPSVMGTRYHHLLARDRSRPDQTAARTARAVNNNKVRLMDKSFVFIGKDTAASSVVRGWVLFTLTCRALRATTL